ncbi:DinB family protein [Parapedobacter tibetensis]|uniref:DinB family protein n=1 Tax=Parapedobacter tibetensis TaxID=2972951 RepID=UPI00214D432B|nr:DinB family protein [Parapedobacter tibetensis]
MEISINSDMLKISLQLYRMHTQLFNNAIVDIRADDAKQRLFERTNHIIWMVGNLVNNRFWLANALGVSDKDPFGSLFDEAKALDESYDYPSLEQLKSSWHHISPLLFHKLCDMTTAELLSAYDMGMGDMAFMESNYLSAIAMSIDREEYLIGQLGLMRKALGYPAMDYQLDATIPY